VREKSIAFTNMEEEEFQKVYDKVLDKVIADTEFTKVEIEKNLLSFM